MHFVKKLFAASILFLFPTPMVAPILRILGYHIGKNARVGFSFLLVDRMAICDGVRIGHFNLIRIRRLILRRSSNISRSNIVNGPLSLVFLQNASIGNRNKITRGSSPDVVAWGATLALDEGARITSDHIVDCTRSVRIGAYSILAGSGSQIWTHGYVHAPNGPGRYRLDGKVHIDHNVYIGSRCIINLGVRIGPSCIVGAGAVVSKTLSTPGLYVATALRILPLPGSPQSRKYLRKETFTSLCEDVFFKKEI